MSEEICKACGKLSTPYSSVDFGGHICQDCIIEFDERPNNGIPHFIEIFMIMKIIDRIEKLEAKYDKNSV